MGHDILRAVWQRGRLLKLSILTMNQFLVYVNLEFQDKYTCSERAWTSCLTLSADIAPDTLEFQAVFKTIEVKNQTTTQDQKIDLVKPQVKILSTKLPKRRTFHPLSRQGCLAQNHCRPLDEWCPATLSYMALWFWVYLYILDLGHLRRLVHHMQRYRWMVWARRMSQVEACPLAI